MIFSNHREKIYEALVKAFSYFIVLRVNILFMNSFDVGYFFYVSLALQAILFIIFEKDIYSLIHMKRKEDKFTIGEYIFPFIMVAEILFSTREYDVFIHVILEKYDIILLILTFGLVAEGIRASHYFDYAAFKITQAAQGNLNHMVIWVFILASIFTYFTSNDIVILVLTPIIMRIFKFTQIHNCKTILIALFIAANTSSMGWLPGSPTNIIYGQTLNISFFYYWYLMLAPTFFAVASCFIAFNFVTMFLNNKKVIRMLTFNNKSKLLDRERNQENYIIPSLKYVEVWNKGMTVWIIYFFTLLFLLAVITTLDIELAVFSLIGILATLILYKIHNVTDISGASDRKKIEKEDSYEINIKESIKRLPWGIVFFAFAFFFIAELLSQDSNFSAFMGDILSSINQQPRAISNFFSIVFSGVFVNILNDLPAASIISNSVLSAQNFYGIRLQENVHEGLLAGLNIGCFVTPVGALAGIIWFDIIQKEKKKIESKTDYGSINTPNRRDLCLIGLIVFFLTAILMSLNLAFFSEFHDILVYEKINFNYWSIINFISFLFTVYFVFRFCKSNSIRLRNIRVLLGIASWLKASMPRKIIWLALSPVVILGIMAAMIYYAEYQFFLHQDFQLAESPISLEAIEYIKWVVILFGSGHPLYEYWPHNSFAQILSGLLPLLVLTMIVNLYRVVTKRKDLSSVAAKKIAIGNTPVKRYVFMPYSEGMHAIRSEEESEGTRGKRILEGCAEHDNEAIYLLLPTEEVYDRAKLDFMMEDDNTSIAENNVVILGSTDTNNAEIKDEKDMIRKYQIYKADAIFLFSFYKNYNNSILKLLEKEIEKHYEENIKLIKEELKRKKDNGKKVSGEIDINIFGRMPKIFISGRRSNMEKFPNWFVQLTEDITKNERGRIDKNKHNSLIHNFFKGDGWHVGQIKKQKNEKT